MVSGLLPLVLLALGAAVDGGQDLAAEVAAAATGTVVDVRPGVHRGPLVIDKPLTLAGAPGAIVDGGGEGDVIRITAPDVTVKALVIRNTGISLDRENAGITVLAPRATIEDNVLENVLFGVYLKGSPDSVIRGNRIGGKALAVQRRGDGIRIWQSDGTRIEDNVVHDSRDTVMWFSRDVVLRRNRVTGGRYGLHFMYSDDNTIEDNHLEGNSVGAFLMYSRGLALRRNAFIRNRGPSGYGVGLKDMDGTIAEDNLFLGNRVGLHFDNSPSSYAIHDVYRHNVFAYNDIGVAFMPAVKRNQFHDNAFVDNVEHVAVLGSGRFEGNDFTVEGRGNYWSDYRGWDLDGNGVGDVAYRAESLFENLMDREPKLRLLQFSPIQSAVETAAKAFPSVRPKPKFADEAPLVAPPPVRTRLAETPRSPALALLGLGLLAAGTAGLIAGRFATAAREALG